MELASAEDAALAIRTMDGFPFDKRHKFAVNRFTDVEKLANLDEQYQEPEEEEYKDRVRDNCSRGRVILEEYGLTIFLFTLSGAPPIMAH
jgi:hypothetical protein